MNGGFGTTWGWVINDQMLILGWSNPLSTNTLSKKQLTVAENEKKDMFIFMHVGLIFVPRNII